MLLAKVIDLHSGKNLWVRHRLYREVVFHVEDMDYTIAVLQMYDRNTGRKIGASQEVRVLEAGFYHATPPVGFRQQRNERKAA